MPHQAPIMHYQLALCMYICSATRRFITRQFLCFQVLSWKAKRRSLVEMTIRMRSLAIASLLLPFARAIEVATSSECSSLCDNDPHSDPSQIHSAGTFPYEMVCHNWELLGPNSTTAGRKWVDCLSCESRSTKVDGHASAVYWFLCSCLLPAGFYCCLFRSLLDPHSQSKIHHRLVRFLIS